MGFLQDITGSSAKKAANAAAADTYAKQQTAIGDLNAYGDTLPGQYNTIAKGYDPYVNAGNSALTRLMAGFGLGGDTAGFTAAYRSLPGYQSGLDTGINAARRGLNAGNMSQSGAALKALERYGSDYEDQRVGDYLTRLMGVSGQGMQATGAQTGLQATGLGQQANLRQSAFGGSMNAAGTIGQGMVAGEQAKQNALTNLMQTGAYLAGTAMGAPMKPPNLGSGSSVSNNGYQNSGNFGQFPAYQNGYQVYGPGF